jgi:hypothetical protein
MRLRKWVPARNVDVTFDGAESRRRRDVDATVEDAKAGPRRL